MLRAKDLMTIDVVSVKTDTPIYQAMELMIKHDISGVPVVEDDMTLVGILSERDVVVLFYAGEGGTDKTVEDFMTQPAVYFEEDENLVDVCDLLVKNIFRRVPVTSEGKVVGIISVKDILEYVLQQKTQGFGTAQKSQTPASQA